MARRRPPSAAYCGIFVSIVTLAGCARFQPQPGGALTPSAYTPTAMEQSVTMEDSSIHYDPAVLKVGSQRSAVAAAFGEPNESQTAPGGQTQDLYAFNPDGTKFVNPAVRPRNVALGVLTRGTSLAVRQARLSMKEKKLTVYKVTYGSDGRIRSVEVEKPQQNKTAGTGQASVP
jgi:hypothetical protein